MANPQLENGHVKIANDLFEAIYMTPMSDYEHRLFLLIIRRTYGFNKKSDWISLSQICKELGIHKANASRTVRKLKERNMITKEGRRISVQKDYEQWIIPEKIKGKRRSSGSVH